MTLPLVNGIGEAGRSSPPRASSEAMLRVMVHTGPPGLIVQDDRRSVLEMRESCLSGAS
jgi:hypothetical protein